MTQLNLGNKGCKNLEGKQESLSFMSPFLVQQPDIFGSSFPGNSCPFLFFDGLCGCVDDALAIDKLSK